MKSGPFQIPNGETVIDAAYDTPGEPRGLYLFAHGAGAGMEHIFMRALTARLVKRGVAVLRFQFPYMQQGRRRPDRPAVLEETVRVVAEWCVARGDELASGLWLAGGKSMGGRIAARVAAAGQLPERFELLAFVGYPLHAAGKPDTKRAETVRAVARPMLFLQGDRDSLADLELMRQVVDELGERAFLTVVRGADHGFGVLKRSGRTNEEVLDELAEVIASTMRQ